MIHDPNLRASYSVLYLAGRVAGSTVTRDMCTSLRFRTASGVYHLGELDKGLGANMSALLQDICARDARDSARSVAPLRMSGDAIEIDTTGITVAQAAAKIISCYRQVPQRAP